MFDKINTNKLRKHNSQDHVINTKIKMFFFESMYNLSMIKFELLRKYLDEFLTKEFIVFFFLCKNIDFICQEIEK